MLVYLKLGAHVQLRLFGSIFGTKWLIQKRTVGLYCEYQNQGKVVTNCRNHMKKHPLEYDEMIEAENEKRNASVASKKEDKSQKDLNKYFERKLKKLFILTTRSLLNIKLWNLSSRLWPLAQAWLLTILKLKNYAYVAECDERAAKVFLLEMLSRNGKLTLRTTWDPTSFQCWDKQNHLTYASIFGANPVSRIPIWA